MKTHHLLLSAVALIFSSSSLSAQIEAGTSVQITINGVSGEEKQKIDALYPVSKSGTVNLPFIGRIYAAGKSPESLASVIQNAYKNAEIYRNPTIQIVSTAESANVREQMVYLGGQVQGAGPVRFSKDLTIYQAIQAAGGSTKFGSLKRVKLYRDGKVETLDVTDDKNMRKQLRPNDTITVPEKNLFGQ